MFFHSPVRVERPRQGKHLTPGFTCRTGTAQVKDLLTRGQVQAVGATRSRVSSCDAWKHDITCYTTNSTLSERASLVTTGCEASETM